MKRKRRAATKPQADRGRAAASGEAGGADAGRTFPARTLWIAVALVAANVAVYAPVWHYGFVTFDDPAYVTANPQVSNGLTWQGAAWAFTTGYAANWHPLTWLSHMLDVEAFGMNAGLHHLINLILHVANSLLLFVVLLRMTGALGRSAFVAALFAVHPLHVESVAWIAERKDVLSTLFWMCTLWAYTTYVRRPGRGRYLLIVMLFAMGLLAKPMLVTLPFVMLLLDVWPLGRLQSGARAAVREPSPGQGHPRTLWLRLIREKLPLFALAAASGAVTYVIQRQGGAIAGLDAAPPLLRAENALISYAAYVTRMFWPVRLSALYPYPQSFPGWWIAGGILFLVCVSWVAIRAARRRPYLIVGWLWYLGTLAPVLGLIQVGLQASADRYTYVPLIGLFIMAAWGVPDLLARWPGRRFALPAAAALLIMACALLARDQVRTWQNGTTLWAHALGSDPGNYLAHDAMGKILRDEGRTGEALAHFAEAVRLRPGFAEAQRDLGRALAGQGNLDEAIEALADAVRSRPDYAEAHGDLGYALWRRGSLDEAISQYSEALRLKPGVPEVHNSLGLALASAGRLDQALVHFTEAVRLRPNYAEGCTNLGSVLWKQGKAGEALSRFQEALRADPGYADAHYNLGIALAAQGKFSEAITRYQEALRLRPGAAEVHYALGLAFAGSEKPGEALLHFSEAVRLRPGFAEAHYNLGVALAGRGKPSDALAHYQEAVRLKPDYEAARVGLGTTYAALGKFNEAMEQFREALRINPQNKSVRTALEHLMKRSKAG